MISDRLRSAIDNAAVELASVHGPDFFASMNTRHGANLKPPLPKADADRLFDILNARFRAWTGQSLKEFSTKETA